MAVVSVTNRPGRTAGDDDKGKLDLTRLFTVVLDSATTTEAEILLHPTIPQPFHPLTLGSRARVIRRRWQQDPREPHHGVVVVEYSSEYGKQADADPNPLLRPPVIRWSSEIIQEAVTTDRDGAAIITPSKETYDPPPTRPVRIIVLDYRRNIQIAPGDDYIARSETYLDHVNETTWYSFLPETAYLADLEHEESQESGVDFIIESLRIKIDRRLNDAGTKGIGWNLRPLIQGFWYIGGTAAAPTRLQVLDTAGRPTPNPVLLDAAGAQLALGSTPVFANHPIPELAEFNNLGLFP